MKKDEEQQGGTDLNKAFIRCDNCGLRAYFQPDWTPAAGFEPRLRQFNCELGHNTYGVMGRDTLLRLAACHR